MPAAKKEDEVKPGIFGIKNFFQVYNKIIIGYHLYYFIPVYFFIKFLWFYVILWKFNDFYHIFSRIF